MTIRSPTAHGTVDDVVAPTRRHQTDARALRRRRVTVSDHDGPDANNINEPPKRRRNDTRLLLGVETVDGPTRSASVRRRTSPRCSTEAPRHLPPCVPRAHDHVRRSGSATSGVVVSHLCRSCPRPLHRHGRRGRGAIGTCPILVGPDVPTLGRATMDVGTAIASAWSAGISMYGVAALLGIAGRLGWTDSPEVLQSAWVITIATALFALEFVIDKIPVADSVWDAVHTVLRPAAGAALALSADGSVDQRPRARGLRRVARPVRPHGQSVGASARQPVAGAVLQRRCEHHRGRRRRRPDGRRARGSGGRAR